MYFKDLSYIFDIYSYFFWKEYEGWGICLIFIICIDNMLVFVVLRRYRCVYKVDSVYYNDYDFY